MAVLKIHVRNLVKAEEGFNEALTYAAGKLNHYFNSCVAATDRKMFSSAEIKFNSHPNSIDEMGLLVYIVADRENTLMPMVPASTDAAGRTYNFSNTILSEIFAANAMNDGKLLGLFGGALADRARQGTALANLAFHELAHNKWFGLPEEIRKKYNIEGSAEKTHTIDGIMGTSLEKPGTLIITPQNIKLMAAMIQYPVTQFTKIAKYNL